jgi:CheY-like chemotaxis protein
MTPSILIVEDNDDNIRLMDYLLRKAGHDPTLSRSAAEGLREAARERPDLILMDLQMPEMDGFDALRAIRADGQLQGVPVIAVTALAMVGDRDRVLAAGFDGYLQKPIEAERFVQEVEGYLKTERADAGGRA